MRPPFEPSDGQVYAVVQSIGGRLGIMDITDPYKPLFPWMSPYSNGVGMRSVTFQLSDDRTYSFNSNWGDIRIMDVTYPQSPMLVSVVLPSDDKSSDIYSHLPDSSKVGIPDWYFDSYRFNNAVVAFQTIRGHTYVMITSWNAVPTDNFETQFFSNGGWFLNVTNPHAPQPVGITEDRPDNFRSRESLYAEIFRSAENRTYGVISDGRHTSWIVDITDPSSPEASGIIRDGEDGFDTMYGVRGVTAFGAKDGSSYVAMAGYEGIQIVNVTDARAPLPAGSVRTGGDIIRDTVILERTGNGQYAFVLDYSDMRVINITDPNMPVMVTNVPYDKHAGVSGSSVTAALPLTRWELVRGDGRQWGSCNGKRDNT